jgi:hypothetical protein
MFGKVTLSFILVSLSASAIAGGYPRGVVMTGMTQMADTVELRFDPAPADTGTLVILGDHSKAPERTYRFVYDLPAPPRGAVNQPVNIDFSDKQKLNILCDTLSDNCRSTGYLTEGSATFSLLWKVTQK